VKQRYREYIIILFVISFMILNYPLLSIFDRPVLLFGIPLLYFYIFAVWFVIIVLLALISETDQHDAQGDPKPGP
jgi:hypothetical protein